MLKGTWLAASLWEWALDQVFPPRCVSCGGFGSFLCARCLAKARPAGPPRCPQCWLPAPDGGRCQRCRQRRPALTGSRAVFVYQGVARDAVHALKYDGVSAVARPMAQEMARVFLAWAPPVMELVPVPLAPSRRRTRGYNQSQLLARELARATGLPLRAGALERRRARQPQVRLSDYEARRRNVEGVFVPRHLQTGVAVLLIDDVMTTGATLDACARALREGGSGPVYALTFARED